MGKSVTWKLIESHLVEGRMQAARLYQAGCDPAGNKA